MNWDRIFLTASILFSMVVGGLAWKTHEDQAVIYAQLRKDIGNPDRQPNTGSVVFSEMKKVDGEWKSVRTGWKRNDLSTNIEEVNGRVHRIEEKLGYYGLNENWFKTASEIDVAELSILGDPRFYNLLRLYLFQADLDGDGFRNIDDFCPQIAGVEETDSYTSFDGCPVIDSDEDDVPDYRDACPRGTKEGVQADDVTYHGLIQDVKPEDSINGCSPMDLIGTCTASEWVGEPDKINGTVKLTGCRGGVLTCELADGKYTSCE